MNPRVFGAGATILVAGVLIPIFDRPTPSGVSSLEFHRSGQKSAKSSRASGADHDSRFTVKHYDLDLHVDPPKKRIFGRATLSVLVMEDELRSLSLNMADSLTATSVQY